MMRAASKIWIATLIASGIVFPACGQTLAPPPLAQGEILLQISARGTAISPADDITVVIPVTAAADTAAAARAANQAKIDRLRQSLTKRGIKEDAISQPPLGGSALGFIENEAVNGLDESLSPHEAISRKMAKSLLLVRLINAAQVDVVRDVLDAQNEAMIGPPVLDLKDDGSAKQKAIADAVSNARAEADAYCETLGLRVLRIARVSNQKPSSPEILDVSGFLSITTRNSAGTTDVTTYAYASIDFIVASK